MDNVSIDHSVWAAAVFLLIFLFNNFIKFWKENQLMSAKNLILEEMKKQYADIFNKLDLMQKENIEGYIKMAKLSKSLDDLTKAFNEHSDKIEDRLDLHHKRIRNLEK